MKKCTKIEGFSKTRALQLMGQNPDWSLQTKRRLSCMRIKEEAMCPEYAEAEDTSLQLEEQCRLLARARGIKRLK